MHIPRFFSFGRVLLALLLVVAGLYACSRFGGKEAPRGGLKPLAVRVAVAAKGSMDVFIQALGTVTPPSSVTVKSRVDGQLMAIHFTEGQMVSQDQLLAEIDPRPFQAQLQQAKGALERDQAQLKDAELDLQRYRKLIKEQSVSQQQLQAQEGLVGQFKGAVLADQGAVKDAELQLSYTRITAPIAGRVGLRKVDAGNMIRASDANGLVLITQLDPMHVVFTLVEKDIPAVQKAMAQRPLEVQAWAQDNKKQLATGVLLTLDNQIDTATGTVKAKAEFNNADFVLFPNQFVNARLKVETLRDVLIIPTSAVQRNNDGFFVYVVREGKTQARNITTGHATDLQTTVTAGLEAGDVVVIDGVDRLRDGMPVNFAAPAWAVASEPSGASGVPGTSGTPGSSGSPGSPGSAGSARSSGASGSLGASPL